MALRHLRAASLAATLLAAPPGASAQPDPAARREAAGRLLGAVRATTEAEIASPQARLARALFWDIRLSGAGALLPAAGRALRAAARRGAPSAGAHPSMR